MPALSVAGRYENEVRAALLAYKERGRRELAGPLGAGLAAAVRHAAAAAGGPRQGVVLIPVPSRRAVARSRGGDHVRRLACRAATALSLDGPVVAVLPALRVQGTPRDSAGLSAADRFVNLAGALVATPVTAACTGRFVVLVDDLVTTGATLIEASRALHERGIEVCAAAAVAATPRRRESAHRVPQRVSDWRQPD